MASFLAGFPETVALMCGSRTITTAFSQVVQVERNLLKM